MPFNIDEIKKANIADVQTITFSNDDFNESEKEKLIELKGALEPFQKLRFIIEPAAQNKNNKSLFIQFLEEFLRTKSSPVIELDLSNNQLSLIHLLSIFEKYNRCLIGLKKLNLSGNVLGVPKKPIANPGRGRRGNKVARGRHKRPVIRSMPGDESKIEQFLSMLSQRFTLPGLKELNLNNSNLFADQDLAARIVFYLEEVSRSFNQIDIASNHPEGDSFTIEQLFSLVKNKKSNCKIMVSKTALPPELKDHNAVVGYENNFNLLTIADLVFSLHKQKIFTEIIAKVQASENDEGSIEFDPILFPNLSDEETQRLANALTTSTTVKTLILPPCNLDNLTQCLQTNNSIVTLDLSNLECNDFSLSSLAEIVKVNRSISCLKIDYSWGAQNNFQQVLESIVTNPTSKLKTAVNRKSPNRCIELIDRQKQLWKQPKILFELIEKFTSFTSISILIDIESLPHDLHSKLANEKLLIWLEVDRNLIDDSKELEQRQKPIVYRAGDSSPKFVLTNKYETYSAVVDCIKSYVKQHPSVEEEIDVEEGSNIEIEKEREEQQEQEQEVLVTVTKEKSKNLVEEYATAKNMLQVTLETSLADSNSQAKDIAIAIRDEIEPLYQAASLVKDQAKQGVLITILEKVSAALNERTKNNLEECLALAEKIDGSPSFGKKLIGLLLMFISVLAIAAGILLSTVGAAATFGLAAPLSVPTGIGIVLSGAVLASGGSFLFFSGCRKGLSDKVVKFTQALEVTESQTSFEIK